MIKTDGGPAFPRPAGDYNGTRHGNGAQVGISIRDYFAAKAMQGWVSDPEMSSAQENVDYAAKISYKIADAMLKARQI